jgi:transcriptional regulator with XRE-family HTH domain
MRDKSNGLKSSVGEQIRQRRLELGLEQRDLQDYAQIGSTTLSRLEQGKANITLDTLERILEVLGMELALKVKE